MLQARFLRPRWLAVTLIGWAALWVALPGPAAGAPLPPMPAAGSSAAAPDGSDPGVVRLALLAQGLAPADADAVLARLSPAERAELAARASEVRAGGDGGILILALILLVAVLLYLPMAGRVQGWW
ncbi:MAG TPA: hypothetical protein VFC42_13825 [Methylomirabilota bacterium]|jgi:hypothetical protein|nr:hypothetical protein [Methylomirabilota bacterium]